MDYIEVGRLADMLRETMEEERRLGVIADAAQIDAENADLLAFAATDSKDPNSTMYLRASEQALQNAFDAHVLVGKATVERKHAEKLIELTVAWLNSKSGVR